MSRSPYTVSASVRGIGVAGHHEYVRRPALLPQLRPLLDAEAVLLVDHRQRQPVELDVTLDERVRADGDIDLAPRNRVPYGGLLRCLQAPPQQRDVDRAIEVRRAQREIARAALLEPDAFGLLGVRRQQPHEGLEVLLGQDLRRRHDRALVPVCHRRQQRCRRDHGLPAADVALQQARHRHVARDIREDRIDRPTLRYGQAKRQRCK